MEKLHKQIFILGGSPEIDWQFLNSITAVLQQSEVVIAVDHGLEVCHRLKLPVSAIVGDFDSVNLELLNKYKEIPTFRHSPEKDQSDLELALDYALQQGEADIFLLNCTGGRTDHLLFNLYQLFRTSSNITLVDRFGTIKALRPKIKNTIYFRTNTTFSLIPIGQCAGVSISGAKYPLVKKNLKLNSLTLSNEGKGLIEIEYKSGQLLLYVAGGTIDG